MPIYKVKQDLLYFAHVPKCAGTSFNLYLEQRFGAPAFQDRRHIRDPARHPWTRTSPQHVDAASLGRLFPSDFFDAKIAIVRHPVDRIVSVFNFQKYRQKTIPRLMPFGTWLSTLHWRLQVTPFASDNHIKRQVEFLPHGTSWFRIEDGFGPIIQFLDDFAGASSDQTEIGHEKRSDRSLSLSESQRRKIRQIYEKDFVTFGYE